MFSTIFWAVPAFSRVEPVRTSGPTCVAIRILASRATGVRGFTVIATVAAPRRRAYCSAASTYGVVPLAVIPTTTSRPVNFFARRSRSAFASESSAPSTAPVTAGRPPAINACTSSGEVPKVGGHSAASRTAIRPLEPAPAYISRPPLRMAFTMASAARATAGSSWLTAAATLRSSRFISRTISIALMRSRFLDATLRCSVRLRSLRWEGIPGIITVRWSSPKMRRHTQR